MLSPLEQAAFRQKCYSIVNDAIEEAWKFLEKRHGQDDEIPIDILKHAAEIFMNEMQDGLEADRDWGDAFE